MSSIPSTGRPTSPRSLGKFESAASLSDALKMATMNSTTPSSSPAIRIPNGLPRPPMMATANAFSPGSTPMSEYAWSTGTTSRPARPASTLEMT